MTTKKSETVSTYQEHLPAILQEDPVIGQFLQAFEQILRRPKIEPRQIITGEIENPPGLETIIDDIDLYFNPQATPAEFLPWLAGWVALSLRDDWTEDVKRAFIQQIVGLYRLRGTKAGLIQLLSTYLEHAGFSKNVEVFDQFADYPHYFQVQLTLNTPDPNLYWRQAKIAQAIIDLEKPAQTYYGLRILVPTMMITKVPEESQDAYDFNLFPPIDEQTYAIKVEITPDSIEDNPIEQLVEQLVVQLQGNSQEYITDLESKTNIKSNNDHCTYIYNLNYQDLADNLEGFNIKLSNQTDNDFVGNMTIKFTYQLHISTFVPTLLDNTELNLSSVLKICTPINGAIPEEGNTILEIPVETESGDLKPTMRITESLWSQPYSFTTFTPPQSQELQPEFTAIIEKIQLEAIIEITTPGDVSLDMFYKIRARFKDEVSDFHLLTPETEYNIESKKMIIKRTIYYQDFLQTTNQLSVTIKNLNNITIAGTVTVQAHLEIDQTRSTCHLGDTEFSLDPLTPNNILQICIPDGDNGVTYDLDKIPTIIGTTTQKL